MLLTDLRPRLTCENPAQLILERLGSIPAASEALAQLTSILKAAAAWDTMPPEQRVQAYRQLVTEMEVVVKTGAPMALQVDSAVALEGRQITREVGAEVARAAELLLRVSPMPQGPALIKGYRQAFVEKYGQDREVPLLELLDPEFGLGPPSPSGYSVGPLDPAKANLRARTLLDLACKALRDGELAVELDQETITRLETWSPGPSCAPFSLDLYAFVTAPSVEAIDAGLFQVVIGPNIGAGSAGRNLGRFADLLGSEAHEALKQAAMAEQAHAPDRLWAELVYLPRQVRSANVVIRPAVREYELTLTVTPGVPGSRVIPLDELVVGVQKGRMYVRWPKANAEVMVCAGHMLNHVRAPVICRFLAHVNQDGISQLHPFDWGPAANFPFLPRVQAGRIILRPAEWRIDDLTQKRDLAVGSPETFRAALARWRSSWHVPRHVYLAEGDNRLLLDLENPDQAEELRTELAGLKGRTLVLQEPLPGPDQAWTPGPGGRYVSELVVPLVLRSHPARDEVVPISQARAVSPTDRLRPPGTEWLFIKLYGPRSLEDDLIAGPLRSFADHALRVGFAHDWFFLRYSDPDPQVRLRFRADPEQIKRLLPEVFNWAKDLMAKGRCLRFSVDTYDREVERYGGVGGVATAEELFGADSRLVAELLSLSQEHALPWDRTALAVLTADDLLAGLGLDDGTRLQWYREQVTSWHHVGAEYRQRKALLMSLLNGQQLLLTEFGSEAVVRALTARRATLVGVADRLATLAEQGDLAQKPSVLYRSFLHMHLNRLIGTDRAEEAKVLSLLLRTRDGLDRMAR